MSPKVSLQSRFAGAENVPVALSLDLGELKALSAQSNYPPRAPGAAAAALAGKELSGSPVWMELARR